MRFPRKTGYIQMFQKLHSPLSKIKNRLTNSFSINIIQFIRYTNKFSAFCINSVEEQLKA